MGGLSSWIARVFRSGPGTELVIGVVGPRGAVGGNDGPDRPWTLHFTLDSWRAADGSLRVMPLRVRRECTRAELEGFMAGIKPLAVIAARVRLAGSSSAELVSLVGGADDAQLAARAAELATQPTRQDARFGTLRLNRPRGWWEGEAEWDGTPVRLRLEAETDEALDAVLRTARTLWDDQAGWGERIQACAVQELLPVKNDSWLDEGERPLSPAQFRGRMRLNSVNAEQDGGFTFQHDDGDLFFGHSIHVWGTLADGPMGADILG